VRLSGVRPGTPADSAGLRAGDVLIGLGGHEIGNLQDFQNALVAHRPGDRVEVRFRRDDQVMSVMVTLAGRASSN
jgi:S1-C subfamily serine protease